MPCGWGCSHAAPAAGVYRQSAGQKGMMPGETEGWDLVSWKEAWGPRLSTSAAVGADWLDGELGPPPPLLQDRDKSTAHDHRLCAAPKRA